jgi:hypothetical protein
MSNVAAQSKEFFELIKAIGEAKSKQEEDAIITRVRNALLLLQHLHLHLQRAAWLCPGGAVTRSIGNARAHRRCRS